MSPDFTPPTVLTERTAVDKTMGDYVIHHDYQNSARLNAFLGGGGERFRVRFAGRLYALTVARP